ncbi:VCBS repeat-containing protein [Maritalea mobilis]|uniref:FG-GAP-like repeat-containing protein n=1 Tax=Maritalea mobilis TaxID=483324 RepID=UPI001C976F2A|nr:FG-GAP-like repeat-containing protein [Maritalea mobilis]MBY6202504.1 VCBS repeat-containing protein [Maritalea mobilis]
MAPRLPLRACRAGARGAGLALGLWLAGAGGALACDQPPWVGVAMEGSVTQASGPHGPVAAWFEDPTTRYAHAVLGDAIEAGTLAVQLDDVPDCTTARIVLPEAEVFEDLAPRLADLTGDGRPEIIVVQSHATQGARLSVYGVGPNGTDLTLYAATPHIGRANRWLAPVGVADLDGDGTQDIAYVDRPHLARTLRVWRFTPDGATGGRLQEIANLPGLSNHRIGEAFITGGIRDCGAGPEIITADAGWSQVMATRLTEGALTARALAPFSPEAVANALSCTP